MNHIGIVVCIALILAACGDSRPPATTTGKAPDGANAPAKAASGPKLALKTDGKDLSMEVKHGVMGMSELGRSDPKENQANYNFELRNYVPAAGSTEGLEKSGDFIIGFQLVGPLGSSNKGTPLAPGTYATEPPAPFFVSYGMQTLVDAKRVFYNASNLPRGSTKGHVKITSVEGDTVKGEIDIATLDKHAIKGSFTTTIVRR